MAPLHNVEDFFDQDRDYDQEDEELIQMLHDHSHEEKQGYLFIHLKSSHRVFIRKNQMLDTIPVPQEVYRFRGFAADSSVTHLEKRM